MPRPTADQIITQGQLRYFLQLGGEAGAGPANPPRYSGTDAQYMYMDSVENPIRGGVTPVNVHDPNRAKRFISVAQSVEAPDLPSATVHFLQKRNGLPRQLYNLGDCPATFYEPAGQCRDLSDLVNGWENRVKIFANGEATTVSEGGQGGWDSDEAVEDEVELVFDRIYSIGRFGIGENAASQVTREVIDVVYATPDACIGCAVGIERAYGLLENISGTPGTNAQYIYSVNGGLTWATGNLLSSGVVSTDNVNALDIAGRFTVVLYNDTVGGTFGYFYNEINPDTGVPQASTGVRVTTGFSSIPNDLYILTAREIWIAGNGGIIYKVTNLDAGAVVVNNSATSSNLNRVAGAGETIVFAGVAGAVVVSADRGQTFDLVTAPSAAGITALEVLSDKRFWVGTDTGTVFYTLDGGQTWTQVLLSSTPNAVQDIRFVNDEVGYMLTTTTSGSLAGQIRTTFDGGYSWSQTGRLLNDFPVLDRVNRLAYPRVNNHAVASNNILMGGLAGDGADGILLKGAVAVV